jgi:hypothetical protein
MMIVEHVNQDTKIIIFCIMNLYIPIHFLKIIKDEYEQQ